MPFAIAARDIVFPRAHPGMIVAKRTTFGRHVYAVGGSAEAARRAGINVARIKIFVFMISGGMAGMGGHRAGSPAQQRQLEPGRRYAPDLRASRGCDRRHEPLRRPRRHSQRLWLARDRDDRERPDTLGYSSGVIFIVTGTILLFAVHSTGRAPTADQGRALMILGEVHERPTSLGILSTADITASCSPVPRALATSTSSPSAAGILQGRAPSRTSTAFRRPTAPTRSCSPTRTSRRSTTLSRTRCTANGRSARSRRASTCSARSRCLRTPPRSRRPSHAAERTGLPARPRRSCTATIRRRGASGELVAEGAIGELRLIRSVFSYGLFDESNIRLRTDVDGGSLMDVGCYCISGSRLLGGEPEAVFGRAYVGPTGTDWVFTGSLRFPGDVLALFDCATCLSDRDELEAIGSEGSLFLDDPVALPEPGDRASPGRRHRADRRRGRQSVPARARGSRRRDPHRRPPRCSAATTPWRRHASSRRCADRPRTGANTSP